MKNSSIYTLIALLLIPFCASAQTDRFVQKPATEAGHSVSLDLLGIHYAYELPLWRTGTIIGRVGANFGGAGGSARTGTGFYYGDYWAVMPSLELEPRWYYGLDRREMHGRSTEGNAGSFLALRVQSRFRGYASDGYYGGVMGGVTFVSPVWGMRRTWASGLMLEFTTGVRFAMPHDGGKLFPDIEIVGDALERLDLNLRFGYSF